MGGTVRDRRHIQRWRGMVTNGEAIHKLEAQRKMVSAVRNEEAQRKMWEHGDNWAWGIYA